MLGKWFRKSGRGTQATAVLEPVSEPSPVAVAREARRAGETPPPPDGPWFSREEIVEFESSENENELARRVSRLLPRASREEALFRYRLSRTVYFQDFELPLLPTTATQVMRLGRDPRATVESYVKVIQSDPSLVSAIVRLANSSFFSAASECVSLDRAIARIGLGEVEKVASIHIFRSRLFRVSGRDALVRELVQHGVAVSIASQQVLRRVGAPRAEAFLAGLFHDVGKLFLLQTIGRVQQKLDWTAPTDLVHAAFDVFHPLVGELACKKWELPQTVCEAVRGHHDPQRAAAEPIGQAVYLGNRIVHALERGDENPAICPEDDPVMLASGLSPELLLQVQAQAVREIEAMRTARG